ncbi:MAG TPA: hypothetical protein PK264_15240, partial [Hyphomicrobiaceae bacterium]|nr:hypothetical protein [Hyphomicrobiaceae bacterium]
QILVLQAQGIGKGDAILIWMIVGPAQAAARFAELVFAHKHSIYTTALASAVLTTASFLAFLPFGVSITTAIVFSFAIGFGHGLFAIARNTLPLTLFGARDYGSYMGLLMVPQNIVNATAPVIFAWLIARVSPMAAMWFAAAAAFAGFLAVLALISACRRPVSA